MPLPAPLAACCSIRRPISLIACRTACSLQGGCRTTNRTNPLCCPTTCCPMPSRSFSAQALQQAINQTSKHTSIKLDDQPVNSLYDRVIDHADKQSQPSSPVETSNASSPSQSCSNHHRMIQVTKPNQQRPPQINSQTSSQTIFQPTNQLMPGWHRRPLPASLIPFSSPRGRQLFKQALDQGTMTGYFQLAEQFLTQSEPAYCGPSTLAMILNALQLDPMRIWKGNWRWFSEEMLETCDIRKPVSEPLQHVRDVGLSFEEMLFLAECNGCHVQAYRADQSNESKFRTAIASACSTTDLFLVASFSRAKLHQTGCGHYSPIAGYDQATDQALILDVARFKYPPYWVPVSQLWEAVRDIDPVTGMGRGYYLMSRADSMTSTFLNDHQSIDGDEPSNNQTIFQSTTDNDPSIHSYTPLSKDCRLAVNKASWARLAEHFCEVLPNYLAAVIERDQTPNQSVEQSCQKVFAAILSRLPVDVTAIFTVYTHDLNKRYLRSSALSNHEHSHNGVPCSSKHHKHHNADNHTHSHSSKTDNSSDSTSGFVEYPTFISPTSSHVHHHSRPIHRAIEPLLTQIEETRLFKMMSQTKESINQSTQQANGQVLLDLNIPYHSPVLSSTANNTNQSNSVSLNLIGGLGVIDDRQAELELATLLLFALPNQIFAKLPAPLQSFIEELRSLDGDHPDNQAKFCDLRLEIENLRLQLGILAEICACTLASEHEAQNRLVLQAKLNSPKLTNATVVSEITTKEEAERRTHGEVTLDVEYGRMTKVQKPCTCSGAAHSVSNTVSKESTTVEFVPCSICNAPYA